MTNKLSPVVFYSIPIVLMIGLISVIENDYLLAGVYILCIAGLLFYRSETNDFIVLLFGMVGITLSEILFISTGVEVFTRNSFLGLMPLWLPLLWGYAFVTIKRCLRILDR